MFQWRQEIKNAPRFKNLSQPLNTLQPATEDAKSSLAGFLCWVVRGANI